MIVVAASNNRWMDAVGDVVPLPPPIYGVRDLLLRPFSEYFIL